MKKFLLMLGLMLSVIISASARDTYSHDVSVLPEAARTIIANNFKSQVSVIKIDKDFGRVSEYEVILTDGTEITFDRSGNWENVETSDRGAVPASFIPKAILDYVAANQPETRIVGIEKERSGYDIELSNGVDMKFNKEGKFVCYDD